MFTELIFLTLNDQYSPVAFRKRLVHYVYGFWGIQLTSTSVELWKWYVSIKCWSQFGNVWILSKMSIYCRQYLSHDIWIVCNLYTRQCFETFQFPVAPIFNKNPAFQCLVYCPTNWEIREIPTVVFNKCYSI